MAVGIVAKGGLMLLRGLLGTAPRALVTTGVAASTAYGLNPEGTTRAFNAAREAAGPVAEPLIDGASAIAGNVYDGVTGQLADNLDDGLGDLIFNNLLSPLGVSREKFDGWYESINPVALGGTFAAIKGLDFGLEKVGIDLISTKTAMFAAVAYHFLVREGMVGEALSYLENNNMISGETLDKIPFISGLRGNDFNPAARGEEVATPTATTPAPTPPVNPETPAVRHEDLAPAGM